MEITEYIKKINTVLSSLNFSEIENLVTILYNAYLEKKCIFIIGNGGSAANADHFAQDLAKATAKDTTSIGLRTISLASNISFITALANDEGYEVIFERQLMALAKPEDILIGISGSGNSKNIIRAVEYAKRNQILTIGICGFDGGKLKQIVDYCMHVRLDDMGMVEAIHQIIFHYLVSSLKEKISTSL